MDMVDDIVALLRLFQAHVPDPETNAWVLGLAADRAKWPDAHRMFTLIRSRTLAASAVGDRRRECQYLFEETCLKSLYNETPAADPFDADSPHWITKCAISLARQLEIPVRDLLTVIAPGT
jgi:hypothetical protein